MKTQVKHTPHIAQVREAVGVFNDHDKMQDAIEALQESGFGRHQISVLGSEEKLKERFGTKYINRKLLEDDPETPRSPDITKEELHIAQGAVISAGMVTGVVTAVIASGGLAVPGLITIAAIGGAGGTAIGAVLAKLLGNKYADFIQHQINQGGLLLWVNLTDTKQDEKARKLLKKYGATDIHIHEVPTFTQEEHDDVTVHAPHIFGEAQDKFEQLVQEHQSIISQDQMLKQKTDMVLSSLKEMAAKKAFVSQEQAQSITNEIEDAAGYARDMAEEEQRVVSESLATESSAQEKEVEKYFAIAQKLDAFSANYRRHIKHFIAL